jgi:hypothetical protein
MGKMLRKMRSLVPRWKRIDDEAELQEYYNFLLEHLRFIATSLGDPWHAENPWAYGLNHGRLYGSRVSGRTFRAVLEFDRGDFDRLKRAAKGIPKDRFMDAFAVPVSYRWMIEQMEWTEKDGITGVVIPGSRRPLDRETWQTLVRSDRVVVLDTDDNMD